MPFDNAETTECAHSECTLPADEAISCVLHTKTHLFCSHRHEQQWLAEERHKIASRTVQAGFNGA